MPDDLAPITDRTLRLFLEADAEDIRKLSPERIRQYQASLAARFAASEGIFEATRDLLAFEDEDSRQDQESDPGLREERVRAVGRAESAIERFESIRIPERGGPPRPTAADAETFLFHLRRDVIALAAAAEANPDLFQGDYERCSAAIERFAQNEIPKPKVRP
jgi:hypothetical protein